MELRKLLRRNQVLANSCDYETTGLNRGLKTNSRFYEKDSSANDWGLEREEVYGYDATRDYLTSADYGDGLANEEVSWSYDAGGNRISDSSNTGTWSYDNLNRMTASPGYSYTNDLSGNRLGKGSTVDYDWDVLNRMTSYSDSNGSTDYAYRADGMRVVKDGASLTRFRYDGQMGFEDEETASSSTSVTRYGIGARGIDYMAKTDSSGTAVSNPIYDGHGNMVATLSRSGSSYALANQRSYGAWGDVRQGSASSDPKGRYCANLGHKQDEETGLVYMRARLYEPQTGRFVSEDHEQDGSNWFIYCQNNPVNNVDEAGTVVHPLALIGIFLFVLSFVLNGYAVQCENRALEIGKLLQQLEGGAYARNAEIQRFTKDLYKSTNAGNRLRVASRACRRAAFAAGVSGALVGMAAHASMIEGYLLDVDCAYLGVDGPLDLLDFD